MNIREVSMQVGVFPNNLPSPNCFFVNLVYMRRDTTSRAILAKEKMIPMAAFCNWEWG